jgi:hypothetical protein
LVHSAISEGEVARQWRERDPQLSRRALEERSRALRMWHGEDYGFTDSEDFVTIANTCFEEKNH